MLTGREAIVGGEKRGDAERGNSRSAPTATALAITSERPERLDPSDQSERRAPRGSDGDRIIFVTNRGPIEHSFDADGAIVARAGAGGVVSGLLSAAEGRPISWISVAMTEADRAVIAEREGGAITAPAGLAQLTSRLVAIPDETYRRYYDAVSNHALWFAQHGMLQPDTLDLDAIRRDWRTGYEQANIALAQAVIAELDLHGPSTPVLFHDYHLYLAPELVRRRHPEARLSHFTHIPWPTVAEWEALPFELVAAIYRGLIAADTLGFQTETDVRNFLIGAPRYLVGATVDLDAGELRWRGRRALVSAYPIALTPETTRASAAAPDATAQAEALRRQLGLDPEHRERKLLVRVDRVEPTKNIVRGFEAYARLLEAHPDWRGRVVFLALLVPSRESLAEYQAYAEETKRVIAEINARFGRPDWQPITALFGNDRARALACMRDYDALLVNPIRDGMNLVAKEGALVNTRQGALILSTGAGAYAQLREGALGVAPLDVEATAQALYRALTLPQHERAQRAARLRRVVEAEDATSWLNGQLSDLLTTDGALAEETLAALDQRLDQALDDDTASVAQDVAISLRRADGADTRVPAGPSLPHPATLFARSRAFLSRIQESVAGIIDAGGALVAASEEQPSL